MFSIQLKQIETAIAAGRLDEAYGLLIATPHREHRNGQHIADKLVARLIDRCRNHLQENRFGDAQSDLQKAKLLAGRQPEIADLSQQIADQQGEHSRRDAQQREAVEAAKIQAELGLFTLGQNLLPSGPQPSRLSAEIERKRLIAADAADRLQRSIESGDWQAGIAVLQSLAPEIRRHRLVADKIRAAIEPIVELGIEALQQGRPDRAVDIANLIGDLQHDSSGLSDLRSASQLCIRAFAYLSDDGYRDADRQLALLQYLIGDCPWLSETRNSLAELIQHDRLIRSGPLGLLQDRQIQTVTPSTARRPGPENRPVAKPAGDSNHLAGLVNLLRVDDLGSILLLDADVVSIGPSSKSKRFDIPIQTDGPTLPLTIRRTGEDYFAESECEFQLNDRPTRQRLLSPGDSIGFGRRGRLKFRKPVAASGSAVLQLTGAGLPRREIRHIALMSDSLLFCASGGHFSLSNCEHPIVVFLGPQGYAVKYAGTGVSGSGGEVHPLSLGRSVLVGETRFTLNQISLS